VSGRGKSTGRIQPLAALQGLRSLDFPPNQFTTRQVAWLRAHLPESVRGRALGPTIAFDEGFEYNGKNRDVLLVGKRKPFLNSTLDARRIERHVSEFRKMVDEFTHGPELQPD
jgi:hypothetical protein